MSMRSKILLYAGLACTALVLAPTTAATAATGPSTPRPAVDFPALTVTIPLIPLPSGGNAFGKATCPAGTVVLSGGADSASGKVAINASGPDGNTAWAASGNNLGPPTTFKVYAVCEPLPAGYTQVVGPAVSNPSGTQTLANVVCPAGDVVTGGGVFDTNNVKIGMFSSYPAASDEWVAAVNNNSKGSETMQAVAVCASSTAFPVYAIKIKTAPDPPGTYISENCPPAKVLGGGNLTSATGHTDVWMNATRPFGGVAGWRGGEYNAAALVPHVTVFAICAT